MKIETLVEPELAADGKLHLFSLYVDFPAALRARWASSQISRLAGKRWKTSSEMWKLDCLMASEPIRKMITQDVADADVLVIAMSSLDWRELELAEWLNSLTAGGANRPEPGLFIGLLGDGRGQAEDLDWTVKQFLRCARQMGRDFIWQWMGRDAMAEVDYWLTDSVEVLLTRKQPGRNGTFLREAALGNIPMRPSGYGNRAVVEPAISVISPWPA